jgi:hypothetical protein
MNGTKVSGLTPDGSHDVHGSVNDWFVDVVTQMFKFEVYAKMKCGTCTYLRTESRVFQLMLRPGATDISQNEVDDALQNPHTFRSSCSALSDTSESKKPPTAGCQIMGQTSAPPPSDAADNSAMRDIEASSEDGSVVVLTAANAQIGRCDGQLTAEIQAFSLPPVLDVMAHNEGAENGVTTRPTLRLVVDCASYHLVAIIHKNPSGTHFFGVAYIDVNGELHPHLYDGLC